MKPTIWEALNEHCETNEENWTIPLSITHWGHDISNVD